jgi:triacylglycerol lipase
LLGIMLASSLSIHASEGVILLHGLCRTPASMAKMATELTSAGFTVENVGYDSRHHSIEDLGDQAIGQALASPRLRDCSRIHFVTHSMGALLVRSYFNKHPTDRLGRVVMLGPPNQGSEVVDKLGSWRLFQKLNGPAGSEMGTSPESTPNQLGPVNFECGVIAGDRSLNWINSLLIPGKDDGKVSLTRSQVAGMKEHLVIHTTHPFIMKNREVIRRTIRFLQTGTFSS